MPRLTQPSRCSASDGRNASSCFRARLPLKIGIHKDIPDGLIEPKVLRLAFRRYVNNPGYLNATRLGAARIDLNGEPAGTVDENDEKSAQARLNGIRKFKKDRKQRRPEEARRSQRRHLHRHRLDRDNRRDSLSGLREAARKRRGAA